MALRRLRLRLPISRGPTKSLPPGHGMRRYRVLQGIGRQLVTCGMHVHVGVEDPELHRSHNQLKYFLPHILAFSTSSPFWDSQKIGLMCYRLSVFDRLPRTGLGEYFESFAQYERYVEVW